LFGSGLYLDLGLTKVFTHGSESSDILARTPYRQPGRPSRFEFDLGVGYPLAEGVVTAWPGFFPATELVLSATAGFRYLYYPGALHGAKFTQAARAVFSPSLTDREQGNLDSKRPPGMAVDPGRYGVLLGLATDIYFHNGLFATPRVLAAVPLLSAMTQTHLGYWWELSLGLGLAI